MAFASCAKRKDLSQPNSRKQRQRMKPRSQTRAPTITGAMPRKPLAMQGKRCAAPHCGGSACVSIKYVLGQNWRAKSNTITRRTDAHVGPIVRSNVIACGGATTSPTRCGRYWQPSSGGDRSTSVYAQGDSSLGDGGHGLTSITVNHDGSRSARMR